MTSRSTFQYLLKIRSSLLAVAVIGLALSSFSCMQTENSSALDATTYAVVPPGSPEFEAARAIFRASCGGSACHDYFGGYTEAKFKADGWVKSGDPDNSKIFCRLAGSTGSCGNKDMPLGGGLSPADLDRIRAWILTI
jgi:hypothetical protein